MTDPISKSELIRQILDGGITRLHDIVKAGKAKGVVLPIRTINAVQAARARVAKRLKKLNPETQKPAA